MALLLATVSYFVACKSTQEGLTTVTANQKRAQKYKNILLVYNDEVRNKVSYEGIKGYGLALFYRIVALITNNNPHSHSKEILCLLPPLS